MRTRASPAFSLAFEVAVWERGVGLTVKRRVRTFGPVLEEATEGHEGEFDCESLSRARQ